MINHRYQILEKLGEGGGGEVFLVEDTLKQRQRSAMKVLHPAGESESTADEQFRNEVSILASLHHPNLVRVFDFGMIRRADDPLLQGRRFFTMEYLRGSSAAEWFKSRGATLHLKQVVIQALGVLAYVHRRGIIHFDIKPENLLLIPSGEKENDAPLLKLTDFGFSTKQEPGVDVSLRGTLEYTAPELLKHESFDHRVDLYSLGATLYHLIEGRCPFEASEPVELIKKVLADEPEFHRCSEPEFLPFRNLISGLLQKDPNSRLKSAEEASRALQEEGQGTSNIYDGFTKPGFVGRTKEKDLINSAIVSLGKDSVGNADTEILILGPEGIGKTALLGEVIRSARASDLPVFEISTSQRDVPFSSVLSLLPMLGAEVMSRSSEGGELIERLSAVTGTVLKTGKWDVKEVQKDWVREKEKIIEAHARFICQSSLLFPFVIVADEANLMDAESREVLRTSLRDVKPGRLLFLMAARDEKNISANGRLVHLDELDSVSVSAVSVSAFFRADLADAIGNRLYELFGGTPAVIIEALHSVNILLAQEVLDKSVAIPSLVEKLIQKLPRDIDQFLFARYKAFDRGPQLVLDMLSCFDAAARLEVIRAMLPFPPQRTAEYLLRLEMDGLVALHDPDMRCSMRHARLKSMVYATIFESRDDIHMFIAATLENIVTAPSLVDLQELAYQHKASKQFAKSMRWFEAAGDEAMRVAAYPRATELYREATSFTKEVHGGMSFNQLTIKLAQSLLESGTFREAIDLSINDLNMADMEEQQKEHFHKIAGLAQSRLGEYAQAKQHITAALSLCTEDREEIELEQEMVGIEIALGNFAEAERTSMIQLDRARGLGDQRIVGSIHTDLGIATFFQNSFDQSIGHFREAMKIYKDLKQYARVADAMMNIGNVMSAKGDVGGAIECWANALRTSKEYGTLNQQAQIQNNLGIAHYKLKRFNEAHKSYQLAEAMFTRLESKQGLAYMLTNLGELNFAEGKYEQALTTWERARTSYRDMDDGQGIVETMLQLAQVHLQLGDVESVVRDLDEAEVLVNEKNLDAFKVQMHYLRGMHMMFLSRFEDAMLFLKQSEDNGFSDGKSAQRLLLGVRMAECQHRMGSHDVATELAQSMMERSEREAHTNVVAEAALLIGTIVQGSPSAVPGKALTFFRRGFDAIAKEPVTEVTWKLAVALGLEYRVRGQMDKAKDFLTKARMVLNFFLVQFTSDELRNKYLAVDKKDKVLAALDSFSRM